MADQLQYLIFNSPSCCALSGKLESQANVITWPTAKRQSNSKNTANKDNFKLFHCLNKFIVAVLCDIYLQRHMRMTGIDLMEAGIGQEACLVEARY